MEEYEEPRICAFCGAPQYPQLMFFVHPEGTHLCGQCVERCAQDMAASGALLPPVRRPIPRSSWWRALRWQRPLSL